jgi:hypothetical protein
LFDLEVLFLFIEVVLEWITGMFGEVKSSVMSESLLKPWTELDWFQVLEILSS